MRPFRFSILQLLLAATLVALVLGLLTAAWRAGKHQAIEKVCFSPRGDYLAALYSGGAVQVWQLDPSRPRLIAQAFGRPELLSYRMSSIHFIANDKLLSVETEYGPSPGTHVRQLDLQTRQVADVIQVDSRSSMPGPHVATADRLLLPDWSNNSIASYSLKTGRLEHQWPLAFVPGWELDLSANGKALAVCGQDGQVHVIDVESGQTTIQVPGLSPVALSDDGRTLAVAELPAKRRRTRANIGLYQASAPKPPDQLQTELRHISWLAFTADGNRLAAFDGATLEYYDVPTKQRLAKLDIDEPATGVFAALSRMYRDFSPQVAALAPSGDRLASIAGGQIVLRELPSGKVRQTIAGGSRLLQIVIFTLGFAVWSVVWGIVAKRERLRRPAMAVALPAVLRPASFRPAPLVISWKYQLAWLAVMIVGVLVAVVALDIGGRQSIVAGLLGTLTTLATLVACGIALVVAYAWVAFFIKGPHYLTLLRLRKLAGDPGRVHRRERLTFWFVGRVRSEADYSRHLDEVLENAETLLGRPVEAKQRRLIACLDRQCDLDAFCGQHIPVAAIIPRYWTDRLALVCEETAAMQLVPPQQALRSALAFSVLIEQKGGFLPGWVGAVMAQQIARDERRPAELGGATRRLRVLLARDPGWDPRRVIVRSTQERLQLWLAQEERQAWREVRAELDMLLTLGEMLLGADAPGERREKALAWLRAIQPKDDPLVTLQSHTGLTLDDLVSEWRQWIARHSGLPFDPLPLDQRWLLDEVAIPLAESRDVPVALRQRIIRQLGSFYVAGAPVIMRALADSKIEVRREAAEALEFVSGELWGDNAARWQTWWQSLPAAVRGETTDSPLSSIVAAATAGDGFQAATSTAPTIERSSNGHRTPQAAPGELKVCWGLMVLSGLAALALPISLLFWVGPIVYPMLYYSLFVGVAAIVRGATRDTFGLSQLANLQMANIMACDPINPIAGAIEQAILRRSNVRHYVQHANEGRP